MWHLNMGFLLSLSPRRRGRLTHRHLYTALAGGCPADAAASWGVGQIGMTVILIDMDA